MNALPIILHQANFSRLRRSHHAWLMRRVDRGTWLKCRLYGRKLMGQIPDLRFQMRICDQMEAQGSPRADVAHIRGGILGRAARLTKSVGIA